MRQPMPHRCRCGATGAWSRPRTPSCRAEHSTGHLSPTPATGWIDLDPWPKLAHRVSQLAALALPRLAPGLTEQLSTRTNDLARGFVRAVRRRDWLQAAGVGRWLARLPDVPQTLGLDSGLAFVHQMGGGDPRVALHVAAAHRFYGRGW